MEFSWLTKAPKLNPNDEVFITNYIIGRSKVIKTYIISIPVNIHNIDGKSYLKWSGYYDLSLMSFPGDYLPPTWCADKYVFTNKEDAEKAAKWWSVEFTDDEWLRCIGDRKIQEPAIGNIESGCELRIGCVNDGTSEIRSWFEEVKEYKGLMEVDRQQLQSIMSRCENRPESLKDPNSLMFKLLSQLSLEWSI